MLLLRVLEASERDASQAPDEGTVHHQIVHCALSIISKLWAYRKAYGLRLEYWLTHACFCCSKGPGFDLGVLAAADGNVREGVHAAV